MKGGSWPSGNSKDVKFVHCLINSVSGDGSIVHSIKNNLCSKLMFITSIIVLCCSSFITAVFKIFKLSPDQFEVVHNLRDLPHKQINLNYSSNDVQWNPKDGENR